MIYLDNAATTMRKPPQVGEAILIALNTMGNSSRGTHTGALDAARSIFVTRQKLAAFFNCPRADHVVFTSNITESLNIAIRGLVDPGDHVITTDLEHNSVLRPLYSLEAEKGVQLSFAPVDEKGRLDYSAMEGLFRDNTKAVVCTNASNLTGTVVDVRRVADMAHAHGALLIVDAAQTAGTRKVDMQALGADVLCFTGHKGLLGPQGTGGLCIREGVEIRPFKAGGTGVQTYNKLQPAEYPTRLEAGTLNGHGIAGLSAAIDYLDEIGVDAVEEKEAALTVRFYEGVKDIPDVRILGDVADCIEGGRLVKPHAGIVALNIRDLDSGEVADALSTDHGIATRPGGHCAPRLHEALGTREQGAVRFSFSWFTSEEEIDAAIKAVRELAAE
jgi:cysteine desulfurase family protein